VGITTASDKERIKANVWRGVRLSLYGTAELYADLEDTLFRSVLNNVHRVLPHILPNSSSHAYKLLHDHSLTAKSAVRNIAIRYLFKDILDIVISTRRLQFFGHVSARIDHEAIQLIMSHLL